MRGGGEICALIVVIAAHAIFILKLLPLVPTSTNPSVWRLASLAAFLMFVLLCICGIWPHPLAAGDWAQWSVFALATAVAWIGFPLVYSSLRLRLRNLDIERNLTLLTDEVATRRAAIEAARRQRHDQRHHRIVLAEYLLRGQTDKALAYLEQLDEEAGETPTDKFIWCENDTLNAILSGYARKAEAKGVVFEVKANVEKTVAISDIELVVVFANLIENAIAACGEVQVKGEGGDWKVCVVLRQRERTIGMTVTNPVADAFALSAEGLPCEESGVGIAGVRRVIERHHGALVYSCENGILTCQAMMRIL